MRLDDGDDDEDDDEEEDGDDGDGELVWWATNGRRAVGSIDSPTGSMTGTAAKKEGRSRGERRWKFDRRLATRSAAHLHLRSRFR